MKDKCNNCRKIKEVRSGYNMGVALDSKDNWLECHGRCKCGRSFYEIKESKIRNIIMCIITIIITSLHIYPHDISFISKNIITEKMNNYSNQKIIDDIIKKTAQEKTIISSNNKIISFDNKNKQFDCKNIMCTAYIKTPIMNITTQHMNSYVITNENKDFENSIIKLDIKKQNERG